MESCLCEGSWSYLDWMALTMVFLIVNLQLVHGVLPRYVPSLLVSVGERSRILAMFWAKNYSYYELSFVQSCMLDRVAILPEANGITFLYIYYVRFLLPLSWTQLGNDLIESYFNLGYTYPEIVAFLCLSHGVIIRWDLKRRGQG